MSDAATFNPTPYPVSYRLSATQRWLARGCVGLVAVGLLALLALRSPQLQVLEIVLTVVLGLSVLWLVNSERYTLVLHADMIEVRTLLRVRRVLRAHILSYRLETWWQHLVLNTGEAKPVCMPLHGPMAPALVVWLAGISDQFRRADQIIWRWFKAD